MFVIRAAFSLLLLFWGTNLLTSIRLDDYQKVDYLATFMLLIDLVNHRENKSSPSPFETFYLMFIIEGAVKHVT